MKSRITMADIAAKAGVHPTSVSMALRNHPGISVETRDRIKALAEEMGYTPDPALAALVAYRRAVLPKKEAAPLAYITNWSTRFGWKYTRAHDRFFIGATNKAAQLGYKLEHFWLGEPELTHERMSSILYSRGIKGLILASHLPTPDATLNFKWSKFSAVKIDYNPTKVELHTVTNDQCAIIKMAVRHTIAAGYRRIGLVVHRGWDNFSDHAWTAGFLGEQQLLDPKDRIPIFLYQETTDAEGEHCQPPLDRLKAWLDHYRPEVLLGLAAYVVPAVTELGLSIPKDLAFVEIYLDPDSHTAGVQHNCLRVGEQAVEILAGQLQQNIYGLPSVPTSTLVEGTWFDGSTLPPRPHAPPLPQPDQLEFLHAPSS